ncbi:MAG: hypothetical protein A3E83_03255 [Gammaproteobacteria bacterium RIFCSPHIGHO2_12_FULL_41_20]|nr:MAG: hypothetical protein A3E83_03255 [Gammaproteobacteria bacterium RIFCSPHIGHO2_12_FULL_41_20]
MLHTKPWLKKLAVNYPIHNPQLAFQDYITQCHTLVKQHRLDLREPYTERIITANTPFELYPTHPIPSTKTNKKVKYGVLLIHGMFDSPFSLRDIGSYLQSQGILVRGMLLPGHGITPGCMLSTSHQDWLQCVRYGVEKLAEEVEHTFVIGFSMGAALAVHHALHSSSTITGLILLAPCLDLLHSINMLIHIHRGLSLLKNHIDWLLIDEEIDYVRYQSIPLHAIRELDMLLQSMHNTPQPYATVPTFIACSAEDEIIAPETAIRYFQHLPGSQHRFILYTAKDMPNLDKRITLRSSLYPELHIQNLSHISMPIAPENIHYGKEGDFLYASHPDNSASYGALNRIQEKYHRWLYQHHLTKTQRKELTYNPDFMYLAQQIAEFIQNST